MTQSVKKLNDPSIPVVSVLSDTDFIPVVTTNGSLKYITFANLKSLINEAVTASGKVLRKVILPPVDVDFNTLTADMTIYSFASDVPNGVTLTNAPVTGAGGFSLICIAEGVYRRQIYQRYGSQKMIVRSEIYGASGKEWSEWQQMIPTAISGGVKPCYSVAYGLFVKQEGGQQHERENEEDFGIATVVSCREATRSVCRWNFGLRKFQPILKIPRFRLRHILDIRSRDIYGAIRMFELPSGCHSKYLRSNFLLRQRVWRSTFIPNKCSGYISSIPSKRRMGSLEYGGVFIDSIDCRKEVVAA